MIVFVSLAFLPPFSFLVVFILDWEPIDSDTLYN